MSNTDKLQVKFTIEQMRQALYRFCNSKYRMCVPAQKDDDDMILSYAIDQLEQAQAENEQLKADKQKLVDGVVTLYNIVASQFATEEDKSVHIMRIARQVLSEVKGNGSS